MSRSQKFFIPQADRRLGDQYELLECLGDGSYGWVWRASRIEDGEIVAVKIPKLQGESNEKLSEGSALVGQAAHANVVSVHWMGRVPPDRQWYVIEMEYFPSLTLAQLLERGDQGFVASYQKILELYAQILGGVAYLHGLGMNHGDIKPQNILVSAEHVKLTDFGCSALPEDMYARSRENGGTVLYSAPEVVDAGDMPSSKADCFKADIYSLGVLLYHLVTTRLPHDTLSQVARHAPFPKVREVSATACPGLDAFVDRCLKAKVEDRWGSVEEMVPEFRKVVREQLEFNPTRAPATAAGPPEDWSLQALRYLEEENFRRAEEIARTEFEKGRDVQAFRIMLTAELHEQRYFDCLRDIQENQDLVEGDYASAQTIRKLALVVYLETRRIDEAHRIIDACLHADPESAGLLFKKAAVLGLEARYEEAAAILLELNRRLPGRAPVLKKLVGVFEQLRDQGKAAAFLRAYAEAVPDDPWALRRLEEYRALGLR